MVDVPEHLKPVRFPRADIERVVRRIKVKRGTTPEMVLEPDFWAHAGGAIRVDDEIQILAEDGSFYLVVLVTGVDPRGSWAHVWELYRKERQVEARRRGRPRIWPDADGYRVEWSGSDSHKWRIIDRAGTIVARELPDEGAAIDELDRIKREKVAA